MVNQLLSYSEVQAMDDWLFKQVSSNSSQSGKDDIVILKRLVLIG